MYASVMRFRNGGGGIRTHEALARPTVFKTAPFDRSGTPPQRIVTERGGLGGLHFGRRTVALEHVRHGALEVLEHRERHSVDDRGPIQRMHRLRPVLAAEAWRDGALLEWVEDCVAGGWGLVGVSMPMAG